MSNPSLLAPVFPYRGLRTIDAWGAGGFRAPRSRAGEQYAHKGLDFLANFRDRVIAPFSARVAHIGRAYVDEKPNEADPSDLGSIHLAGIEDYRGFFGKLFYVFPATTTYRGAELEIGAYLGEAQDRSAYATAKDPMRGKMLNHVHFELYIKNEEGVWIPVNPAIYISPEAEA